MSNFGSKLRTKWVEFFHQFIHVLDKDIWDTEQPDRSRIIEILYYLLRILSLVKNGFARNNVFVRALALSYSSLLALGPLAAIMLIIGGFLLQRVKQDQMIEQINNFAMFLIPPLKDYMDVSSSSEDGVEGSALINEELLEGLEGFIESAQSGAFGVLGILILILIAIQLFATIEKAFNDIWGVRRGRSVFQRIVFYWTFLSLGALLSLSSLAIYSAGTYVTIVEGLPLGAQILMLIQLAAPLLSFFLILILLTSFYRFIPNTQVDFLPALGGAFIVTLLLVLNTKLSVLYVTYVVSQQSLYGSLGIISILMLAMYIVWVFVLIGGQITYAIQNANFLANQQAWENTSRSTREVLSMASLVLIARRFKACEPAYSSTELSRRLRVPGQILNESLSNLMDMGFITILSSANETKNAAKRYQPAKPLNKISLFNFKKALDNYGNSDGKELILKADPLIRKLSENMDSAIEREWESRTLEELLEAQAS